MATIAEALSHAAGLHQTGRLDEAEIIYRRILDVDDGVAGAWHLLGVVHAQTGRFAAAADLIGRAVALDGTVPDYHRHRAMALEAVGRLAEAVDGYRAAHTLAPALADAAFNAGVLLDRLGRGNEADSAYAAALESDPNHARAANNRALNRRAAGDAGHALALLAQATAAAPDFTEAWLNRGMMLAGQGNAPAAAAAYARAAALEPANAAALEGMGRTLRAAAPLRRAVRLASRETDGLEELAAACDAADPAGVMPAAFRAFPFLFRAGEAAGLAAAARHNAAAGPLPAPAGDGAGLETILTFWGGQPLRPAVRLALRSMVAQGHPVRLYSYDPVAGLPAGVVWADARTVLDEEIYQRCVRGADIRFFSDLFRYRALHRLGGWWLDTDMVLLRPLRFATPHVFCTQWGGAAQGHMVVNDAIRAPQGSPFLEHLFGEGMRALDRGGPVPFGAAGPLLLTRELLAGAGRGLLAGVVPPMVFNPVDWTRHGDLDTPGAEHRDRITHPRVAGVHLWHGMWGPEGPPVDAARPGGILHALVQRFSGSDPVSVSDRANSR